MHKLIKLILPLTIICKSLSGQDIHFSQYYNSPLTLSATQTGSFDGDWRVSSNYRNQWKQVDKNPYVTYSVGFDKQETIYNQQINWGLIAVRDETFANLNSIKLLGSLSYTHEINRHHLTYGLQFGWVNRSTKMDSYTFDNQFELGGENVFNRNFATGETGDDKYSYFDLNAGVEWSKRISKRFTPSVGLTFAHLTMPHESFYGDKNESTKLGIKTGVFVGGKFVANPKYTIHPHLLYNTQRHATDFMVGSNVERHTNHNVFTSIYAGTLFRYGWEKNYDASIWIAGVKFYGFDLGFSYDINLSTLSEATNHRGAFEVSLIYISSSTKPTKIQIPCDRL